MSFDLFDTLVDLLMERLPRVEVLGQELRSTHRAVHDALVERSDVPFDDFARALREVDRELREPRYRDGVETPTEERFARLGARLGLHDDAGLPGRLTEAHMGMLRELSQTPLHHAAVLARVAARTRVGLCSNFSHAVTARRILDEAGLTAHLDAVVISEELGLRKPRPEIFDALLEGLGTAPEETLHVGDNLDADVAGAAARGLRTVWITRRVPDPEARLARHRGPAPDFVVRDLSEVAGILEAAAAG